MKSTPTKPRRRIRSRFLSDYAQALARELNDYLDGSDLCVRASIEIGDRRACVVLTHCDRPVPHGIQTAFSEPTTPDSTYTYDKQSIFVTKPCTTMQDLVDGWSNVVAWLDSNEIISEILTAKGGAIA